ncbi:MAG: hypothetical protein ACKERG_04160 [Candidatus Hodgkinia cicadicola]
MFLWLLSSAQVLRSSGLSQAILLNLFLLKHKSVPQSYLGGTQSGLVFTRFESCRLAVLGTNLTEVSILCASSDVLTNLDISLATSAAYC